MNPTVAALVGIGVGLALGAMLIEPSSCCKRVSAGVRDELRSKLGAPGAVLGAVLAPFSPGLLDLFGV